MAETVLDARRPDEMFDRDWYLSTYPDVLTAEIDPWKHFVLHGEAEGRAPGPRFDPAFYRRTHMALEADHAFTHYVAHGRALGLAPQFTQLTPAVSTYGFRAALRGRPHPILILGNDARAAGAPLLLLEIAQRLRARGASPVFLLRQGGPLIARFMSLGPTLIADEGWDLASIGEVIARDMPILANTCWGADLADRLGVAERTVTLIHEMTDYIVDQDLLDCVSRSGTVIASMPRTEADLRRLAPALSELTTIVPGLRTPVASRAAVTDARRVLDAHFGTPRTVYLGAGYADQRKGFDLFLDAAEQVAALDSTAAFVWLGEASAWAQELAEGAAERGVRLLMPGFRADATAWYRCADVFLLTSRQDPGPTTVMDAAAVGVPFVGLATEIGLRDLVDVVDATGEFVADTLTLARRAVDVARSENRETRRARSRFVTQYRSLDTYVADIERVLVARFPGYRVSPAGRVRVSVQRVGLRMRETAVVGEAARRAAHGARTAARQARRIAPLMTERAARRLARHIASVGVAQSPDAFAAPVTALSARAEIAALGPRDRAWLSSPSDLSMLADMADVHLLRDAHIDPWPVITALESASSRVARIFQYDVATPPRWAASGTPPRAGRRPLAATTARAPIMLTDSGLTPAPLARPIGVFVHAYYPELLPVITDRLGMITHPLSLYVSTSSPEKAEQVLAIAPTAHVRVFPNQGRDIAPKVFGFAAEHRAHDVVLHLHTKRSLHRSDLSGWLTHILDCLAPTSERTNEIIGRLSDSGPVGMVSPLPHSALGVPQWGPNRSIAEVVTWGRGWPTLPDDTTLTFPAGSMFWARAEALRPLQDLAIPFDAFSTTSALDGTLAHAVERLIGVSCANAGWDQVFAAPVLPKTTP